MNGVIQMKVKIEMPYGEEVNFNLRKAKEEHKYCGWIIPAPKGFKFVRFECYEICRPKGLAKWGYFKRVAPVWKMVYENKKGVEYILWTGHRKADETEDVKIAIRDAAIFAWDEPMESDYKYKKMFAK